MPKYDYYIYESCPSGAWADWEHVGTNRKEALASAYSSWMCLSKHDQERREEYALMRVRRGIEFDLEQAELVKDFA